MEKTWKIEVIEIIDNDDDTCTLHFEIEDSLHAELSELAALKGQTFDEFFRQALIDLVLFADDAAEES